MNSINWSARNIRVLIAQLVEHCSANEEAMGSNPIEAVKNFWAKICNYLNWDYNCDDCDDRIFISSHSRSSNQLDFKDKNTKVLPEASNLYFQLVSTFYFFLPRCLSCLATHWILLMVNLFHYTFLLHPSRGYETRFFVAIHSSPSFVPFILGKLNITCPNGNFLPFASKMMSMSKGWGFRVCWLSSYKTIQKPFSG